MKKTMMKLYKVLFKILGKILPKDDRIIVFESFLGKQYSDNPRAIYEYIEKTYPNYKLYWSVEKKSINKLSQYDINIIRRFGVKWLIIMTRAKYWVSNSRLPGWIPKPYKTVYLQTWHGTPLKKLALDMDEVKMPGTNTDKYKANFIKESAKWDYLISPNTYSTKIFKRAFAYKGTVIESGYPRNDYLVNFNSSQEINRIKTKLNISQDKKVVLYAPTWRDDEYYERGRYKFELPFDIGSMYNELGDEYIILLRMHYLISDDLDLTGYNSFIKDVSSYEDIRELYLVSDILITDYSSVFFDFSILRRPIIFYAYDLDTYRDDLRGFYLDYESELPGPIVANQEELLRVIKLKTYNDYKEKAIQFYYRFNRLENGDASKKVVSFLKMNNDRGK